MGSIALGEHIMTFFSRVEKPFEGINSCLFLMNKKGLELYSILYSKSTPPLWRWQFASTSHPIGLLFI
jgi:hypothetical protein